MSVIRNFIVVLLLSFPAAGWTAEIDRFVGRYAAEAEFEHEGELQKRDLGVVIEKSDSSSDGFILTWTSVTYRSDGRTKERSYTIEFLPSEREHIYGSAMKANLFGKSVPLNPLIGEPFVWAGFKGDTLSVFSLFIDEAGEYEIQEFHRTLVPEGLSLVFLRLRHDVVEREIKALLKRQ